MTPSLLLSRLSSTGRQAGLLTGLVAAMLTAPLASAALRRSACVAGMAAERGSAMPSVSATQAMVLAVPITAQEPAVVASRPSTSSISARSTSPAR